jgi:hypothetical protein
MSATNTIASYLKRHHGNDALVYKNPIDLPNNYAVGIELELEGVTQPPDLDRRLWTTVSDGSLRNNGTEIICARPLSGSDLERGLGDLESSLMNLEFDLSERCSTHIHIDATDMTVPQLLNFLILSSIFENSLFTLFGAERRANTFCLSVDRGSSNFDNICKLGTDPCLSALMDVRWSKYAGISLNRIRDLGTVEFRMFSPLTKKAEYMRVLRFLFAMKQEAMTMGSIQEIITYKKAHSLSELFGRIFPDEAYSEGFEEDIENGIQLANDIIVAIELEELISSRTSSLLDQVNKLQDTIHSYNGGI